MIFRLPVDIKYENDINSIEKHLEKYLASYNIILPQPSQEGLKQGVFYLRASGKPGTISYFFLFDKKPSVENLPSLLSDSRYHKEIVLFHPIDHCRFGIEFINSIAYGLTSEDQSMYYPREFIKKSLEERLGKRLQFNCMDNSTSLLDYITSIRNDKGSLELGKERRKLGKKGRISEAILSKKLLEITCDYFIKKPKL